MLEIFKNLKTLFFSYMSIIVLLFFAVLQSNQAAYESALSELKEIEKLTEFYDETKIVNLINNKLPGLNVQLEKSIFVGTIDFPVKIIYQATRLDYGEINRKLEGSLPTTRYTFSGANQDRYPADFTRIDPVETFLFRLPSPKSIKLYQKFHDQTLTDILIPSLTPDFSLARVEAYQRKVSSYNSIDEINTREYQGFKVFDKASITNTDSVVNTSCQLGLFKTVKNKKYSYICNITGFVFEGVKFSGARILFPSKQNILVLGKQELKSLHSIPLERQIPFSKAYSELFTATKAYSDLDYDRIGFILESEKSRNPSKLSLFGAELNIPILTKLIFPILIILSLYIYLHLQEARQRITRANEQEFDVPWIGLYINPINKYAILIQLLVFPVILMGLIHIKSQMETALLVSWGFCIALLCINYLNYSTVCGMREALHHKPMLPTAETSGV